MSFRKPIIITLAVALVLLIMAGYAWSEGYLPGSPIKRNIAVNLSPEMKDRFTQQVKDSKEKIQANGEDFDSWISLGIAEYQLGNLADAAFAYESAGALRPTNSLSFSNLGDVYVKMGKLVKARLAYERALANNQSYEQHYLKLAEFLQTYVPGSKADIEAMFERGVAELPNNYTIVSAYAGWREQVGDFVSARILWEQLLRLNPGNKAIQDAIERINGKIGNQSFN